MHQRPGDVRTVSTLSTHCQATTFLVTKIRVHSAAIYVETVEGIRAVEALEPVHLIAFAFGMVARVRLQKSMHVREKNLGAGTLLATQLQGGVTAEVTLIFM